MYIFIVFWTGVIVVQAICINKALQKIRALKHEIYLLTQIIQRGKGNEPSGLQ